MTDSAPANPFISLHKKMAFVILTLSTLMALIIVFAASLPEYQSRITRHTEQLLTLTRETAAATAMHLQQRTQKIAGQLEQSQPSRSEPQTEPSPGNDNLLTTLQLLFNSEIISGYALLDGNYLAAKTEGHIRSGNALSGRLFTPPPEVRSAIRYLSQWCEPGNCYVAALIPTQFADARPGFILFSLAVLAQQPSVNSQQPQGMALLGPPENDTRPDTRIDAWGLQAFVADQPLTPLSINALSQTAQLTQLTATGTRLKLDQQSLALVAAPLALHQDHPLYLLNAYDLGPFKAQAQQTLMMQIITAVLTIVLIVVLALLFLRNSINRLRKLGDIFVLLSQRRFNDARTLLSEIERGGVHDESDALLEAADTVSRQLQDLEMIVSSRNQEMEKLSLQDSVTGLPNRHVFLYELQQEIANLGSRPKPWLAIILIDLDNFKRINDSLGHQHGDLLLNLLSKQLLYSVPLHSITARLGGDEFVILLPPLDSPDQAEHECRHLLKAIQQPQQVFGKDVVASGSIGYVVTERAESAEELIKHAELAMYKAKKTGGNAIQRFEASMAMEANQIFYLEGDIRRAFSEQEFTLYLQPKVTMNGLICGFESLIRWDHPERGTLPPGEFIPAMEKLGMITQMDSFVLEVSCRQLHVLEKLYPDISIAVNISPRQFADPGFIDLLQAVLARYPITPSRLEIEITETLLMEDMALALNAIARIKALGIHIAIDDFGTGYSSLSYLKNLPVDTLKIDREFIKDIPASTSDMQISSIIIFLAKQLNFKVVAEGVETAEQLAFLNANGCDMAQGFYFSKPVPAHQAILLLESERLETAKF